MFLSADDMIVTFKFPRNLQNYTLLEQISLLSNISLFNINTQESTHVYTIKINTWKLKLKTQYYLNSLQRKSNT